MTQQQIKAAEAPSESDIADYLMKHPDFFERHTNVLLRLKLPHAPSGATISLVERQIALLRQQNDKLQRNLKELVAVAKQNDGLVAKIHRLGLEFLREPARRARFDQLETALREDFGAHRAVVVLFEKAAEDDNKSGNSFVRYANRDDTQLQLFKTFLNSARIRCGLLREKQKQYLFGDEGSLLGSAAMVPLGEQASHGFLVIGNRDKNYFRPSDQTDFLERLGELVATAIFSEPVFSKERAASE
jgi:uncharacterized protein YigA (DUF484 family)